MPHDLWNPSNPTPTATLARKGGKPCGLVLSGESAIGADSVAPVACAPACLTLLAAGRVSFCILEQWVTDCLGQSLLPIM
jgi:hypothetical protein